MLVYLKNASYNPEIQALITLKTMVMLVLSNFVNKLLIFTAWNDSLDTYGVGFVLSTIFT